MCRRPGWAPARNAVGAGVVFDHAVPGALERLRAHHDVAARRGQAVQQQDRQALAGLLAGQRHASAFDREVGCHDAAD